MNNPKVSIVIPFHWMKHWQFFLTRCLGSIEQQIFKDYEVILTKAGSMPVNTNRAILNAHGEIIKILYMDDYLVPEALEHIVNNFKGDWLATGCLHDNGDGNLLNPHLPSFDGILKGENTIGSPSVIAIKNKNPLLFDENMTWLLDVDYYQRAYRKYGEPTLLKSKDVVIGIGDHQMTNILTADEKIEEYNYLYYKNHG